MEYQSLIQKMVRSRTKQQEELDKRIEANLEVILSESPIFFLELFEDPPTRRQDPLTFHRTESTSYDEILDYIIEKEIYHYFDDKFKTNAIDEVNRLREAKPPTKDNPVIVLCNLNAHQLKGCLLYTSPSPRDS